MKKLILPILLLTNLISQAQDDCTNDTTPPIFVVPEYCFLDTVYSSIEEAPDYWTVQEDIYYSLWDNCTMVDNPPCYCGPTLVSHENWNVTDISVTHRFYAYDYSLNSTPYTYVTFYFYPIGLSIPEIKDNALEASYLIYDLNGRICNEPLKKGLYLKVYENRVKKIIVE